MKNPLVVARSDSSFKTLTNTCSWPWQYLIQDNPYKVDGNDWIFSYYLGLAIGIRQQLGAATGS